MAASATDILSLDAAALQLGINRSAMQDNAQTAALDARLAPLIDAAVSFAESHTGRAYIDRNATRQALRPADPDASAWLTGAYLIKSVSSVRYWSASATLRDEPDGLIAGTSLGRQGQSGFKSFVYAPAAGWPEILPGTCLMFDVVEGVAEVPAAITQACVVLVRDAFNGMAEMRQNSAATALLNPHVWHGARA